MRDISDSIGSKFERMTRKEITAFQSVQLQTSLKQAAKSDFYAKRFREYGIDPDKFTSVEQITELPFTTKEDLRLSYPHRMLSVPQEQVIRMHTSSGTTGKPTAIFHTSEDIDNWAELMARSLYIAGARPHHIFQNMTGYGLFTGGLGLHYGAERLGMWTIPAGAGNTARQIMLIRDFGVKVIHATPSYAMHVAERMLAENEDPRSLGLEICVFGAEPYSEEMRLKLQDLYACKVFNSYGLSEMNGPGVGFECVHQNGMHFWEDSYIVEIIDPDTLQPVKPGEVGELVLTTLRRTAMPIIRYRTRDLTYIKSGPCPCGREHVRIARMVGRSDDMLIVRGVNVFPSQIEEILLKNSWLGGNYVLHLTTQESLDQMTVKVELAQGGFDGSLETLRNHRANLAKTLKEQIGFTAYIELVESGSLPTSEGKAKRVIDERVR